MGCAVIELWFMLLIFPDGIVRHVLILSGTLFQKVIQDATFTKWGEHPGRFIAARR
jgi:hypothetical protein